MVDKVRSTEFAFSEDLVRFEVETRTLLSSFRHAHAIGRQQRSFDSSHCRRIGFGGSRILFRRALGLKRAAGLCVFVLTRALQRRPLCSSASLQRPSGFSGLLESPARSKGSPLGFDCPRTSNDRQPGGGRASHKVSVPFSVDPAVLRCPVHPASGRSRFGIADLGGLSDFRRPLALAVFRSTLTPIQATVLRDSPSSRIVPASASLAAGHASPRNVVFIGRCSATCSASHPRPGRELRPDSAHGVRPFAAWLLSAAFGMSPSRHPHVPFR